MGNPHDRLPSYLQSLHQIRPTKPSLVSTELGSDISRNPWDCAKHLEASRSIFSSRYMQNRHTAQSRCKLFTSSEDIAVKTVRLDTIDLVELSGIEPLTPCLQSRCSPS